MKQMYVAEHCLRLVISSGSIVSLTTIHCSYFLLHLHVVLSCSLSCYACAAYERYRLIVPPFADLTLHTYGSND
jgi:hypothetical protein